MQLFSHSIDIARPRADVFAFFTDWEKAPLWRQYVKTMKAVSDGPLGVGSQVTFTIDLHGEEMSYTLTVLAYDPPKVWRHSTTQSHFSGFIEYRFDEIPAGTRVTFSCEISPKTAFGWFAMPQMWLSRGKGYRDQLPALKRAVEGDE